MTFNPDKFEPTHRTPQGLVRAKQWHRLEGEGSHPAVRPLEEVDRRALRRQNLPAHEAHVQGQLQVGYLDPVGFVYPGQWIYQDSRGDYHLRDNETHAALAIPLPHTPDTPPAAAAKPETDRPRSAGTVERPVPSLDANQGQQKDYGDALVGGPEKKE